MLTGIQRPDHPLGVQIVGQRQVDCVDGGGIEQVVEIFTEQLYVVLLDELFCCGRTAGGKCMDSAVVRGGDCRHHTLSGDQRVSQNAPAQPIRHR